VSLPIYLDYAATTPVDPRVAERMAGCLTLAGNFGNPASRSHLYGWRAEEAVESARRQVADLIGADPREIVWTSGATESDNLALKGAAHARRERGRHIVTSAIEHKAVLDSCAQLEREGFEVTYLAPAADGLVTAAQVGRALRTDTVLVSVMHANNELGTINDIAAIGALCRERGVLFHVDAAQSAGKIAIDLATLPVDLMSLSAHKLYGPKGIGALYVRRRPRVEIEPQMHGGGHERGLRSGTLPTHQIVGMGEACAIAQGEMAAEAERITGLRQRFLAQVEALGDVHFNGDRDAHLPGIVNLAFGGVDGESLLLGLKDLAVSSGSACTSASLEPSYVLKALGIGDALAHAALRFSFGRFTSEDDIALAAQKVCAAVQALRGAGAVRAAPG
jgi:cysteine desulfurase